MPFRRWIEVELHHVDLGIGYELEDLPEEFTEREINFLADRFAGPPRRPDRRTDAAHGRHARVAHRTRIEAASEVHRHRPAAATCSAGSPAAATGPH